jgi:glycosyltransferase involved in cell wall biosynthesis
MEKILCFHVGYAPIDNTINYGSEIALLNLARQLKNNYNVYIFGENISLEFELDGIKIKNSREFKEFSSKNAIDIIVVSRYLNAFIYNTIVARKIFIWVHDILFQSSFNGQNIPNNGSDLYNNISHKIDGIIVLSGYHKMVMMQNYSIPENKIHIIGNAINADLFSQEVERQKYKFIYSSYPSRGLDMLLKIFPLIRAEFNNAELYIYRDHSTFTPSQFEEIKNHSDYIFAPGFMKNEDLIREFQSSNIWLYPTNFVETYCISALEAQMAGCLCITSPLGSLSEIVGNRGILIEGEYGSQNYIDNVIKTVKVHLNSDLYKNKIKRSKEWSAQQNWKIMSEKWMSLFS